MIIQIITTFLPWTAVTCFATLTIARGSDELADDNFCKLVLKWFCSTVIMTLLLTALILFTVFTTVDSLHGKFISIQTSIIFSIVLGWGLINSAHSGKLRVFPLPLLIAFELIGFLTPAIALPSLILEKIFV